MRAGVPGASFSRANIRAGRILCGFAGFSLVAKFLLAGHRCKVTRTVPCGPLKVSRGDDY